MQTEKTSVVAVKDKDGNLIAILYKDEPTRHNIIYLTTEADFDAIEAILNNKTD